MDIYKKRHYWKRFLLLVGVFIVVFSILYLRSLAQEIALQEKQRAQDIANAYLRLNSTVDSEELNEVLEVISGNTLIPVIYTYSDHEVVYHSNYDSSRVARSSRYLDRQVRKLKVRRQFIELAFDDDENHYLFYGDSELLRKVKLYPFFQLGLIGLFMLISYIAFSASRRAEQNRVWVGMAKETAHQLGTPLSSIAAWIDILRDRWKEAEDREILGDMEKDVSRLELVADRFSKIGSPPKLSREPVSPLVRKVVQYISKRAASGVDIQLHDHSGQELFVMMNTSLMDWVLENLLKNALDAIEHKGTISVSIAEQGNSVLLDINDSGKGISKSDQQNIFEPGYSTKKRGWGLGLALARRIVEQYHQGRIYVKQSTPGKGTTFRIEIDKA